MFSSLPTSQWPTLPCDVGSLYTIIRQVDTFTATVCQNFSVVGFVSALVGAADFNEIGCVSKRFFTAGPCCAIFSLSLACNDFSILLGNLVNGSYNVVCLIVGEDLIGIELSTYLRRYLSRCLTIPQFILHVVLRVFCLVCYSVPYQGHHSCLRRRSLHRSRHSSGRLRPTTTTPFEKARPASSMSKAFARRTICCMKPLKSFLSSYLENARSLVRQPCCNWSSVADKYS